MPSPEQNSSNQSAMRKVLAWPSSAAGGGIKFPEQNIPSVMARPNAGVCFSGGGARAYSAAWGQLRALADSGYLDKFRYMSGISGGSWAVTNFSFFASGQTQGEFLGLQLAPGSIDKTLHQARQPPNCQQRHQMLGCRSRHRTDPPALPSRRFATSETPLSPLQKDSGRLLQARRPTCPASG